MAEALGINLDRVIRKDRSLDVQVKVDSLNKEYNKKEKAIISSISKHYFIDIDYLLEYLNESETTVEKAYEKITNYEIEKAKMENRDIKVEIADQNVQGTPETKTVEYNRYFNSPFDYKRNNNESISPVSGSLTYESQDLSLPGRNGLDVNIVTRYESAKSNIFKPVLNCSTDYIYEYDYDYKVYGYGTGYFFGCVFFNIDDYNNNSGNHVWEVGPNLREDFNVPNYYINTYDNRIDADIAAQNNIHTTIDQLSGNPTTLEKTYKIVEYYSYVEEYISEVHQIPYYNYSEDIENCNNEGLGIGWYLGFSNIEIDGEYKYIHLANGQTFKINITPFEGDSNLENYTLRDIRLEYDYGNCNNGEMVSTYVLIHKDGKKEYFAEDGRLLGIKDSHDNTIIFNHNYLDGYPVISRITDTVGRMINIQYIDTSTGREVRIIAPNNSAIRYILTSISGFPNKYMLREKIDANGNRTIFDYSIAQGNFSLLDKSNRVMANFYANLMEITYPTNAKSSYSYEMTTGNFGNTGSVDYYRLKTREDIDKSDSYNKENYAYNRDYTGYMFCDDPEYLPENFIHTTTVIDSNTVTEHIFNNKHLLVSKQIRDYGQNTIKGTDYEYNFNKLPIRESTISYGQDGTFSQKYIISEYNDYGDIIRHINELGGETYYEYDVSYHLPCLIYNSSNGGVTNKAEYGINPANGNIDWMKKHHFENGIDKSILTEYSYDIYGNLTAESLIQKDGRPIEKYYNYGSQYNNVYLTKTSTRVTDYEGNTSIITEAYEYDFSTGNKTAYTNGNGKCFTYQYDNMGRLIEEKNPDNTYKSINYDDINNITTVTNEVLFSSRQRYDGLGRPIKKEEQRETGWVTLEEKHYNMLGEVDWVRDASGNNTSYQYDLLGRLTRTTFPDGTYTRTQYIDNQNRKIQSNEEGHRHNYVYDSAGNLKEEWEERTDENNTTRQHKIIYQNTKFGKIKNVTDLSTNASTEYTYDDLNRLVSVRNALNEITSYEYDNLNNVTRQTTAGGSVTEKYYDELGRLYQERDPLLNSECTSYNGTGNILKKRDRNRIVFSYIYDDLSRLKTVKNDTKNTVINEYEYSPVGNMISAGNIQGTTHYEYYINGKLKKETSPDGKYIYYEYNNDCSTSMMIDHYGKATAYGYDVRGRLKNVTIDGKTTNYRYYSDGSREYVRYPDGIQEEYYYDECNNLIRLANKKANGTIINEFAYTYYDGGNQKTKIDKNGKTEYLYDVLDRVKSVSNPDSTTISYEYDRNGNVDKEVLSKISSGIKSDICITDYVYDSASYRLDHVIKEPVKLNILRISPTQTHVLAEQQIIFTLSGTMSNGSTASDELLNQAVWASGSPSLTLSTTKGKRITALIPKASWDAMLLTDVITLKATLQGKTVETKIYKNGIKTLTVSPTESNLLADQQVTFTLAGTMSDGQIAVDKLLNEAVWTVDSSLMTLSATKGKTITGIISKASWDKMLPTDVITVRITLCDKFAEAKVYKNALESLSITPSTILTRANQQMTFSLSGNMKNGRGAASDILGTAVWTTDSTKLTLNATEGSSISCVISEDSWNSMDETEEIKVRGTIGDISAEASIKKDIAVVSNLYITPTEVTIVPSKKTQLVVSGEMSDGTAIPDDILNAATWSLSPAGLESSPLNGKSIAVGIRQEYWRATPNGAIFTVNATLQGKTAQAIVKKHKTTSKLDDTSLILASIDKDLNHEKTLIVYDYIIDESTTNEELLNAGDVASSNGDITNTDEIINADESKENIEGTQELDAVYDVPTNEDSLESSILYFKYDNNGNTIEERNVKTSGEEITTYRYNDLNQLIQHSNSSGTTAYTYNPSGLRETKSKGAEQTKYYYDGQNVIIETINNSFSARNIFGINPIARETNNSKLYYLYNGHADVVAMVDDSGNVINSYDYDIYGDIKDANEQGFQNPIRYAGQYYDNESELYYLRARYYDPELMRFITEDANRGDVKDPLSLNLYNYCVGNPIRYYDKSGNKPLIIRQGGKYSFSYSSKGEEVIWAGMGFLPFGSIVVNLSRKYVGLLVGQEFIEESDLDSARSMVLDLASNSKYFAKSFSKDIIKSASLLSLAFTFKDIIEIVNTDDLIDMFINASFRDCMESNSKKELVAKYMYAKLRLSQLVDKGIINIHIEDDGWLTWGDPNDVLDKLEEELYSMSNER